MDKKPTNPKDAVGALKVPMSVLPATVMAEAAVGMLEGAVKYGRHNYRGTDVKASVYYDATQRHLLAWWEGQDIDSKSGLHHVTKAITSLIVLRDAMLNGSCIDDRPPTIDPDFIDKLNVTAEKIIKQHANEHPRHYTIKDKRHGKKA